MRFYQHHIGDWVSDTDGLSFVEYAIYHKLIVIYYTKEQPLPSDIAALCRLLHAVTPNERKAAQSVIDQFFTLEPDGKLHQKRCDKELTNHAEFVQLQKSKIAKRWNGHETAHPGDNLLRESHVTDKSLFPHDGNVKFYRSAADGSGAVASTTSDTDGSTNGIPTVIPTNYQLPINTLKAAAARVPGGSAHAHAQAAAAAGLEIAPNDPRLAALVADGATPGECRIAAAKAIVAGKGPAYFFATVSGMRRDAASIGTGQPQEGTKTGSGPNYPMLPRGYPPERYKNEPK